MNVNCYTVLQHRFAQFCSVRLLQWMPVKAARNHIYASRHRVPFPKYHVITRNSST